MAVVMVMVVVVVVTLHIPVGVRMPRSLQGQQKQGQGARQGKACVGGVPWLGVQRGKTQRQAVGQGIARNSTNSQCGRWAFASWAREAQSSAAATVQLWSLPASSSPRQRLLLHCASKVRLRVSASSTPIPWY